MRTMDKTKKEAFKKYGTYLGILVIGLFLGYLIFGKSEKHVVSKNAATTTEKGNFTCTMHPKVNRPDEGQCPVCGMALVETNSSDGYQNPNQFQLSESAIALANIETVTVGIGGAKNNVLRLSGKISSNETTNAVQTSIFDGRIDKLNVNYLGAYVKKGQPIGTVYAPDLYDAQDKFLNVSEYKGSHKRLYDAARNTFGLWKMTDEQIDQVVRTQKPIVNFPMIADVSGTVTEIFASEGSFYKQGDPLFKVSNLNSVWALFEAYENQLPFLKVGDMIVISSKAFPGKKLEAKISLIEPVLNETRRTAVVRANLKNKDRLLKPGMFVEGQIQVEGMIEQVVIPESAVLWTGKRSVVYKKPNPDKPLFEMTEVVLGSHIGDSFIVINGLSEGDEVVVNGTFTVDAAAQLQGKKSMMNSEKSMIKIDGEQKMMTFGPEVEKAFNRIIYHYIDLKESFVASDDEKIVLKAKELRAELEDLHYDLLSADIVTHITRINKSTDLILEQNDIKSKRDSFKQLSESLIGIASYLTDLDQPLYVQHCPMADDNRGGNWLSLEDEIRNPYFGDRMLTCGEVTRTLQ